MQQRFVTPGRSARTVSSVFGLVFVALALTSAQAPPLRDQTPGATVPAKPTGTIRGRVLGASDNQPLREADVRLSGGALRESIFSLTDGQGRFSFEGLPPGSYTVAAFKTGHAERSFGQRRSHDLPTPLNLGPGETMVAEIRLPITGTIVVRLFNATGEPAVGLQVQPLAKRFSDGHAVFTVMGLNPNAVTDDRGEVRLFGLPEGDYYVIARSAQLTPLQRPPREGETFYPGTRSSDRAMPVSVSAGAETAISLVVEPAARLSRIDGFIFDSSGLPATGATVTLTQHGSARTMTARVDRFADGSFVTAPLAPGEYVMQVRLRNALGQSEYARSQFLVSGDDIQGAVLNTKPGAVVTGRIVLDESGARVEPRSLRLDIAPVAVRERWMSTGTSTVSDDWSFEIKDLMATGAFRVGEPSGQWRIKHVLIGGRDITDLPVDFRAGTSLRDVHILLTRRAAQVGGVVVGAPEAVVVTFPTDPALWTPTTTRIALTTTDPSGGFVIRGLPSGDYHVVALDGLQRGAERDVDTLRTLAARAVTVQLAEGESRSISLKAIER